MGVASSKIEEDKALVLCRERKKFVRQALDGRCCLAAAHVSYIQSLKVTGIALRKFVQPEPAPESSLYTSTSATPEPPIHTEKSFSQFSFSSPSISQRVDGTTDHFSPSPSPPISRTYHANHMRFQTGFSKKVEEKPPIAVTGTITSSSTPQNATPRLDERVLQRTRSDERVRTPPPPPEMDDDPSPHAHDNSPWDYFGLFHPIDNHLTPDLDRQMSQQFENDDNFKQMREDEEMPELEENEEEKLSSPGRESREGSLHSEEDEFDDPSSDNLVRSFENLNRARSHGASVSPTMLTAESATPEHELLHEDKSNSPHLSPFRDKASDVTVHNDAKTTPAKEDRTPLKDDNIEHKVAPKDIFLSMRDVEYLFIKASDSGREVPRMLEANKFHFRPIVPGKEMDQSVAATLLKACFSCGKDPSQMQEEPAQNSMKYLTWQRTTSSCSSTSQNPFGGMNSRDDIDELKTNLFENICMISGSHASTLDRLYAWERKLYDEVKASQTVRRNYDLKCKFLREQESRDESSQKVDKTRAVVKDLHSRIRVSIHRIDSISKKIEDLRDKELQPQLEELVEGLRRMWEVMSECHRLQVHIITIAYSSSILKIPVDSDLHRHAAGHLQDQLHTLASSFTKWLSSQKSYVQAINNWLHKCVVLPQQQSTRKWRKARPQISILRKAGPPIYTTCGLWLETLETLPVKEVCDTTKGLATEISRFLPRGAVEGKRMGVGEGGRGDPALEGMLNDDASVDSNMRYDQFRSSLVIFLNQLSIFSESSVKMYRDLQKSVQDSKRNYEQLMARP